VDLQVRLAAALAGRYAVEREVGRGGMGIVFGAQDLRHSRAVAIKVLRPEIAAAIGPQRFEREIRVAAGLQHPGILPVYDSGADGDLLYYVMPFVDGESLRDLLRHSKQLPVDDAVRIAAEVADALGFAHKHGIVHRDIKPENILLEGGHAVVADFGLARVVAAASQDELTTSGIVLGTPAYMSPEQASGEAQLDGRSDVYSLGCVLYELLAGEPPFTGATLQAVMAKQVSERPTSLRIMRPTIPPWLHSTVNVALAKVPADRFSDASHFADALRKARRPVRFSLVAALALVAAVGGGLVASQRLLPRGVTLDAHKVIGFPLITVGMEQQREDLGWLVALGLGTQLESAEPLIWRDGYQWLEEAERADSRLITARKADGIARAQRARFRLGGSIIGTGDSASVVLQLYDVEADSLVFQQTAVGPADAPSLIGLGVRAAGALLPKLLEPGRKIDVTPLEGRNLSAVALWIQGEREYRTMQFERALELYQRAVGEDSGLTMAALKGAQAASWLHRSAPAEDLITVARAREELLPARHRYLARGLEGYLTGAADTAAHWLRASLTEDPEWAEAYTALGEVFYHLLPHEAKPLDGLAEEAFDRAVGVDSAFYPPYYHLTEIALRQGDVSKGRILIERLRASDAEQSLRHQLTLMLECVDRGPERTAWAASLRTDAIAVFGAAKELAVGGAQASCAEAAFQAVLASDSTDLHWGAVLGLQGLFVSEGRQAEARALVDSVAALRPPAMTLYFIDALADTAFREDARKVVQTMQRMFGENYERLPSVQSRWFLGVWHAQLGEPDRVARLMEPVGVEVERTSDPQTWLFYEALRGHHALARGDTSTAIDLLSALRPQATKNSLAWTYAESLAVERLILARLLLARGRYDDAIDVASTFDHPGPIVHLPLLTASLLARYSAATMLGRSEAQGRFRARLLDVGRSDLLEYVNRVRER